MTEIVAVTAVPSRHEYSKISRAAAPQESFHSLSHPQSTGSFFFFHRVEPPQLFHRFHYCRRMHKEHGASVCLVRQTGKCYNVYNEPVSEEKKSPKCASAIFKDEKCLCGSAKI